MTKIFIGYKFTGVPLEEIHMLVDPLMDVLKEKNHEPYCNLYDVNFYEENNYGTKEIMNHALNKLSECGLHIVLIDNEEISQGVCLEIGWSCKEKKPIVLFVRDNINVSTLEAMVFHVIRYSDIDDMIKKAKREILI
jgi:nucleoside 2-deoxyribosyltransferase